MRRTHRSTLLPLLCVAHGGPSRKCRCSLVYPPGASGHHKRAITGGQRTLQVGCRAGPGSNHFIPACLKSTPNMPPSKRATVPKLNLSCSTFSPTRNTLSSSLDRLLLMPGFLLVSGRLGSEKIRHLERRIGSGCPCPRPLRVRTPGTPVSRPRCWFHPYSSPCRSRAVC